MGTDSRSAGDGPGAAPTRVGAGHGFSALPAGARLDRYIVESVIAAGGFGITYVARHEALGRIIAIKEHFPRQFAFRDGTTSEVRPTDPPTYTWALDRFLQEGRSLSLCKHPNVVDVTDVFEANGTAYMVLGYEDGVSLKTWRDLLGRVPTQAEVDVWLPRLLDALAFIHGAGLLHRDLAPDNILIRKDGSPCLIDFGAARQALAERSQMMSAIVKGGFSPPEQYTSTGRSQGPWSDVYAMGATLYRTLTGRTPPEATERQLEDELAPIAAALADGHDFRPGFLAGIDQAMRLRIGERPQSVAEWRPMLLSDARPAEVGNAPASTAGDGGAPTTPRPVSFTNVADGGLRETAAKARKPAVPVLVAGGAAIVIAGLAAWSLLRGERSPSAAQAGRPNASSAPVDVQVVRAPRPASPRLGESQATTAPVAQSSQPPTSPPPDAVPPPSGPPVVTLPPIQAPAGPTPTGAPTPSSRPQSTAANPRRTAASGLPAALASLLSDADLNRIADLEATKTRAIDNAKADANRDDDQREGQAALAQVLKGGSLAIDPFELVGNWRCRSVQVGSLGVFSYNYFRCQISRTGAVFQLHKTTGSQRKLGRLVRIDDNRFLYLGQSYIEGGTVPSGYAGDNQADEVGILVKPAAGRFRLELPERHLGVEFIELVK